MSTPVEFPLYNILKQKAAAMDDIPNLWNYVINMPHDLLDMIYVLIWHHYLLESLGHTKSSFAKKTTIPYKGKVFENGKGIVFYVKDVPLELQKIITVFIDSTIQL
jgi:hypothetical protein